MTDIRQMNRQFLKSLLEIYKAHPALWKVKSKEYLNRKLKDAGYNALVKFYQKVDPKANRNFVIKKIQSLRGSYRVECRKIKRAQKNGETYIPNLWYFDLLHFIRDQKISTADNDDSIIDNSSSDITLDLSQNVEDEQDSIQFSNNFLKYADKEFITKFIKIYRAHPALWKIKSKEYVDQQLKNLGYDALIKFYQTIDPGANRVLITKKIQSLRGAFRKELRKVKRAEENGEMYIPTLWYFDLLRFVGNEEILSDNLENREDNSTNQDENDSNGELESEIPNFIPSSPSTTGTIQFGNREFLIKFIEIYKKHPALWKINSKEYSDRNLKIVGYNALIKFYQTINPDADRTLVSKKIQSLRGTFRKELRKVKKAEQNGQIYVPSLWYFDLLLFVRDQEISTGSFGNTDDEIIENESNLCQEIDEITIEQKSNSSKIPIDIRHLSKKFLTEFIEIYKAHPALWKIKSNEYSNRKLKDRGYDALVKFYRKIDPDADRTLVTTKIQSLRGTFRNELRKVQKAQRNGQIYIPSLWYFDLLHFIRDQIQNTPTDNYNNVSSIKVEQLNINEENSNSSDDNQDCNLSEHESCKSNVSRKRKRIIDDSPPHDSSTNFMKICTEMLENTKKNVSDSDVFGQYVASKYAKLNDIQRIYAETLIMQILNKGILNKLTENTKITDRTIVWCDNENSSYDSS